MYNFINPCLLYRGYTSSFSLLFLNTFQKEPELFYGNTYELLEAEVLLGLFKRWNGRRE